MKKLIVVTITLFILITSFGLAELEVPSLTDGELIELYRQIGIELYSRGSDKVDVIPEGKYVAGETIKPGAYLLTTLTKEDGSNVVTKVMVRKETVDYVNQWHYIYIELNSGDDLLIQGNDCLIMPVESNFYYAP